MNHERTFTLHLAVDVRIDGTDAAPVARGLRTAVDLGDIDLAMVNMLRDELRGVTGDWRIVGAVVNVPEPNVCLAIWRNRRTGYKYVVRVVEGHVAAACGPLEPGEDHWILDADWQNEPDLAAHMDAHADDYAEVTL